MYVVYALIDPRDNKVRYVGFTDNVYRRFQQHVQCADNNPEKMLWVQGLKAANIVFIMQSLESVETAEQAKEREDYWILHFKHLDMPLFNRALPSKPVEMLAERKKVGPYLYTLDEASKKTGYSVSTLRQMIRNGTLKVSDRDENKVLRSSLNALKPRYKRTKSA